MSYQWIQLLLLAVVLAGVTWLINAVFETVRERLQTAATGTLSVALQVAYGRALLQSALEDRRTIDGRRVAVLPEAETWENADALVVSAGVVETVPADATFDRVVVVDDMASSAAGVTSGRWHRVGRVDVARAGKINEILDLLGVDRRSPDATTVRIAKIAVLAIAYALVVLIAVGVVGMSRSR